MQEHHGAARTILTVPMAWAGRHRPTPLAFEAVAINEPVKTWVVRGHKSPARTRAGAVQDVLRKVTLLGISQRGHYRWAEAMRGLNISRISVGEQSQRWAAGQNPTGPIPQVVPLLVLSPLGHWKPFEKTLFSKSQLFPELLVALQI